MVTKSKNSRPFSAWLAFFLAINLILIILFTGLGTLAKANGNFDALKSPFVGYENSYAFKQRTTEYFNQLTALLTYKGDNAINQEENNPNFASEIEMTQSYLNNEGTNLLYYAANQANGLVVKNTDKINPATLALPAGYNYYWYFNGQQVQIFDGGKPVDINRLDSGYRELISNTQVQSMVTSKEASSLRIVLAVKDGLEANPYARSMYHWEKQFFSIIGGVYIGLAALALLLLAYSIYRRHDKRLFDKSIARYFSSWWVEIKLGISLIVLWGLLMVSYNISASGHLLDIIISTTIASCLILCCGWWCYMMLVDLIFNRRGFFTHNLVNAVLTWHQQLVSKYPWQQAMLKRAYALLAAEALLALLSVIFLIATVGGGGGFATFMIAVLIAVLGCYLLYRYLHQYNHTVTDLGELIDHIERIKNGDMNTRLEVSASSDTYLAAENLNSIQEGMNRALEARLTSERMKIDLITNVSHDLKTPLTSIISYVDLLGKEDELPEHIQDYIQILGQKSDRLKNLIQDLFDLSKASSDNIELNVEKLDLSRLVKQTLGDLEEQTTASGLTFRVNIPEEPVNIYSDGSKLYRVLENLIGNTLKYSLPSSRVFIDLTVSPGATAALVIKNIANYEMDFTEEEILQRFVRGDKARSNEGSGLGLSIAQSFTQICGGKFSIKIDGDLFKVELRFPTI